VRQALRARHYSFRTEEAYVGWIKRFIFFHGKRHPAEMGEPEVNQFLTDLAVTKKVSASTQNQALSALLFLYQHVLNQPLGWINPAVRAKKPERLPVVLTRQEVKAILSFMEGSPRLVAALLYGAGLRLRECLQLRVKDVDFTTNQIEEIDHVSLHPLFCSGVAVAHAVAACRCTASARGDNHRRQWHAIELR